MIKLIFPVFAHKRKVPGTTLRIEHAVSGLMNFLTDRRFALSFPFVAWNWRRNLFFDRAKRPGGGSSDRRGGVERMSSSSSMLAKSAPGKSRHLMFSSSSLRSKPSKGSKLHCGGIGGGSLGRWRGGA